MFHKHKVISQVFSLSPTWNYRNEQNGGRNASLFSHTIANKAFSNQSLWNAFPCVPVRQPRVHWKFLWRSSKDFHILFSISKIRLFSPCHGFLNNILAPRKCMNWIRKWDTDFSLNDFILWLFYLIRCGSLLFTPGEEFSHCPPKEKERWITFLGILVWRGSVML